MLNKFKGELIILLAAIIWGSAYVFQKMGMDYLGPFTFGFFRFTLGAIALLPLIWVLGAVNKKRKVPKEITPFNDKQLIIGSILCGLANFAAGTLQQIGLIYTTAGKAGFITAMDIVIIPIILLFMRKKVAGLTWVGVVVAGFGLYLLCITENFTIQMGDAFVMCGACAYAVQVMCIDYYAKRVDAVKLSCLQFFLAGILSGVIALFVETIDLHSIIQCAIPILYTAILEVSVAYTLQMVGQKYTSPAVTAIILSLEALFSVISASLFLGETMTTKELIGCGLMLAAFIIAQIPEFQNKEDEEPAEQLAG